CASAISCTNSPDHRFWIAAILSLTCPGCVSNSAATEAKKQPPGRHPFQVRKEGIAERPQTLERIRDAGRRLEDLSVEDLLRGVEGRELKLLLRAEVRVQAALAHPDVGGEVADR